MPGQHPIGPQNANLHALGRVAGLIDGAVTLAVNVVDGGTVPG